MGRSPRSRPTRATIPSSRPMPRPRGGTRAVRRSTTGARVVGVLTFVSLAPGAEGAIVQGFNFVIPSAAVTDFVRGTPVKLNGTSKFNDVWYAGLTAFYAEDYPGALRRFEEADKLHPNLPDVRRKLVETREYVKNPPPKPFPWFWVAIGVTVAERGRLRRPVAASLEQEPLPGAALRGGPDDGERQGADHPRRPQRRRLRAAPAQDSRLDPRGAGGPGQQPGGPRPGHHAARWSPTAPDPTRRPAPGWRATCARWASRTCGS